MDVNLEKENKSTKQEDWWNDEEQMVMDNSMIYFWVNRDRRERWLMRSWAIKLSTLLFFLVLAAVFAGPVTLAYGFVP